MATLRVPNMRHGYLMLVDEIRRRGAPVAPRGEPTHEVLDLVVELDDPLDALPVGVGRNVSYGIAAAETVQLVGGFSVPKLLTDISPNFERFLEASGEFHGAYGRRIGRQLEACERKLRADPDTRQAVITLWDPMRDNQPARKDYPCTVSLQFTIRDDRLNLHVHMRSNDVYLGVPYDFFQFTQLQLTMCNALGIFTGRYYHHATSMHAYDRDLDRLEELHPPRSCLEQYPCGFGAWDASIFDAMLAARRICAQPQVKEGLELNRPLTTSEEWYAAKLESVLDRTDA